MEILNDVLVLLNPETIIKEGGLALLLFVIFAETGLFFGFFLPGDSLLFIAGLLVSTGYLAISVVPLVLLLIAAAILGNIVGYYFGRRFGQRLAEKKNSKFYKKKYLQITTAYYERQGSLAIIIGRFLPIIRTFVPILAGMVKLHPGKFMLYNIVGAFIWVPVFVFAGFWLGQIEWVREHLELLAIPLFFFTVYPLFRAYIRHKRKSALEEAEEKKSKAKATSI